MIRCRTAAPPGQRGFTLIEMILAVVIEDIEEDVPVDKDSSLAEGFVFSRTVDEKPDPEEGVEDDGLYVVRTVVTWADGKEREEIIRYLRDTTQ